MKTISKVLVLLLALTLAVSSLAIASFAADTDDSYLDMLEYYEAGYFVNEQFNSTDLTKDTVFSDRSDELSVGGSFTYTPNAGGTASFGGLNGVTLTATPDLVGSFGVNLRAALVAGGRGTPSLKIQIMLDNQNSVNLINVTNQKIEVAKVTLNESTGKFVTEMVPVTVSDLSLGTFFDVELFYEKLNSGEKVTLAVKANGTPVADIPEITLSGYEFSRIKLMYNAAEFDYLEMYKGSFQRRLVGFDDAIAADIAEVKGLYDSAPLSKYLEVVAKVFGVYGFKTDNVTKAADKAAADAIAEIALDKVGNDYAAKLASNTDKLLTVTDYNEKLQLANELLEYDKVVKALQESYPDINISTSAETITAKRAILAEQLEWLETNKANTIYSVNLVSSYPEVYFIKYDKLDEFYQLYKDKAICESYYDETLDADTVKAAYKQAESLKTEYIRLEKVAKLFVENVKIAADTTVSLTDRYTALAVAKANYFDDETYDAYLDDGDTISALVSSYNAVNNQLSETARVAEDFLSKMLEAKNTLSYSVMTEALDEAEEYLDTVERAYPGVEDAVALYSTLRTKIDNAIEAAEEYIEAVVAVQSAKTVADKKTAITAAKAKAELGSDVSIMVDVNGVTVRDANIILSNEESAIILEETKNSNFIEAVDAIEDAKTLSARRSAIFKAIAAKGVADTENAGVADSIKKLDAAIASYNEDVAAANASADECKNALAASVCGFAN